MAWDDPIPCQNWKSKTSVKAGGVAKWVSCSRIMVFAAKTRAHVDTRTRTYAAGFWHVPSGPSKNRAATLLTNFYTRNSTKKPISDLILWGWRFPWLRTSDVCRLLSTQTTERDIPYICISIWERDREGDGERKKERERQRRRQRERETGTERD